MLSSLIDFNDRTDLLNAVGDDLVELLAATLVDQAVVAAQELEGSHA